MSVGSQPLPAARSGPLAIVRDLPITLVVATVLLVAIAVIAIVGPIVLPGDPIAMDLHDTLRPPSPEHLFGTDNYGRDVFLRVVDGASIDLEFGLFAVVPTFILGVTLGLWAGGHRRFDATLMRVLDVVVAFPFLIVIIAVVAFLGPNQINFFIAVLVFGWAAYARMVRNQVLVVRRMDYVAAATLLGFSERRILRHHVLPNVIVQPVLMATTNFVAFVLLGSALGYLGIGIQPPTPEWGVMIAGGRDFLVQAPWISVFPGLAIVVVSIAFILLGDGLSDVLRPELSTDR